MNTLLNWSKTILVTLASAALAGTAQYLQSGGSATDTKGIATAAISGAVVGAAALFIKPPITSPAITAPPAPLPPTLPQA